MKSTKTWMLVGIVLTAAFILAGCGRMFPPGHGRYGRGHHHGWSSVDQGSAPYVNQAPAGYCRTYYGGGRYAL